MDCGRNTSGSHNQHYVLVGAMATMVKEESICTCHADQCKQGAKPQHGSVQVEGDVPAAYSMKGTHRRRAFKQAQ